MEKRKIIEELAKLNAEYEVAKQALNSFKNQYEYLRSKLIDYIKEN